jgi:hypothetical protein
MGEIFNYAVEMGSGAVMNVPSFIKIRSGIQKLIEGDTQTHRQQGDLISVLLFFQNKENRLRIYNFINIFRSYFCFVH